MNTTAASRIEHDCPTKECFITDVKILETFPCSKQLTNTLKYLRFVFSQLGILNIVFCIRRHRSHVIGNDVSLKHAVSFLNTGSLFSPKTLPRAALP